MSDSVDLSVSYYNSKPQVKGLLAHLRRLVTAIDARDWHEPVPQLSQLAVACRNDKPRAIRDRLTTAEYARLVEAARAGVCKRELAAEFGISRRSVYRVIEVGQRQHQLPLFHWLCCAMVGERLFL